MIDMKNTSNGEPVTNQAPAEVTTATPAAEATATAASETTAPATLDEATHAAHRQRVEELKKSLTSYSNTGHPSGTSRHREQHPSHPGCGPGPHPRRCTSRHNCHQRCHRPGNGPCNHYRNRCPRRCTIRHPRPSRGNAPSGIPMQRVSRARGRTSTRTRR